MKQVTCPQCKGAKNLAVGVTEISPHKPTSHKTVSLPCPTCDGAGKVTQAVANAHQRALASWCDCGNPSGETTHYRDGEHPSCSKHCWTCNDCGKLVQVG